MHHWLLKTEAAAYSWDDLIREGETEWTGVRNHAAAANLRAMVPGDLALFYHSVDQKAAVGIAAVTRAAQPDGDDGKWVSVAIRPVEPLARPVTLAEMKAAPALAELPMIRQSRLSVSPVSAAEWRAILALAKQPASG